MANLAPSLSGSTGKLTVSLHNWRTDLRRKPHIVAPLLFAIAVVIYVCVAFLNGANLLGAGFWQLLSQLIQATVPVALLAIGSGLVIAAGHIDLSSGAIAALSGIVFAILVRADVWLPACCAAAMLTGTSIGAINGFLVARLAAPSLIVTWVLGVFVTIGASLSAWKIEGDIAGIPLPNVPQDFFQKMSSPGITIFLATLILAVYFCATSRVAKEAMAVGTDWQSAAYTGIRPRRVILRAFVASGVFAAVAGILYAYSLASARAVEIQANSLVVVAICVLGGTLLSGGYYSALSIVFSAALWSLMELAVPAIELPEFLQPVESRLIPVVFASCVLVSVLLFSRQLSGHLHPVLMSFDKDD